MDWERKLSTLAARARELEPDAAVRGDWATLAMRHAEHFLDGLQSAPTYVADHGQDAALEARFPEHGAEPRELLRQLSEGVETSGINPASGGHLGYIPGGGLYPSALGDFLADVSNRFSGLDFASPGAARMERMLVRWMADLVGLPDTAGGDLTSGGSVANLAAIVTAREAGRVTSAEVPRCSVYTTRQVHHCVDRALAVAGLSECPVRFVPQDARQRMDAGLLERLVRADLDAGLRPWLVVASAGTANTGAVDPLLRIADVARRHGLWLHVDAAYGGFFLMCEEGREALPGLAHADSVVMDPHKGLFLPYGTGAVLVRDVTRLARAHAYHADYMQDASRIEGRYSASDLSMELSRPFRGLRLWLPLRLFGLAPFRAALAEKIWLARYFHEKVQEIEGMMAGPYPDLSVVTFRYAPDGVADEVLNRRIHDAVLADGRVFISTTQVDGQFTLRAAILHFRTHREQVDTLLSVLRDTVAQLRGEAA